MALYTRDGRPITPEDFKANYDLRGNNYRVLSNPSPICPACRKSHAKRTPHLGPPDEWAYEQVNREPYRELDGEQLGFLDSLNGPWKGRWSDLVALTLHRRPVSRQHWLRPGDNLIQEDLSVCLAPAGARAELLCGVAFHITRSGRAKEEARTFLAADSEEVMVIAGFTGMHLRVDYPLGSVLWDRDYFHRRGSELDGKLARQRKAAIIQSVKDQTA